MKIWVDADACPSVVKDILFRAATRVKIPVTLVANRWLATPPSPWIRQLQVAGGFDVADREIVARMEAGDLVVTADIPLAAQVVEAGGIALNPRGELYTADSVGAHLARRNLLDELRSVGEITGGPAPFSATDQKAFAGQLDRLLARWQRSGGSQGR
jgi:uncharacterized protein